MVWKFLNFVISIILCISIDNIIEIFYILIGKLRNLSIPSNFLKGSTQRVKIKALKTFFPKT